MAVSRLFAVSALMSTAAWAQEQLPAASALQPEAPAAIAAPSAEPPVGARACGRGWCGRAAQQEPLSAVRYSAELGTLGLVQAYEAQASVKLGRRLAFGLGAYGSDVFGQRARPDAEGLDVGISQGYFVSATRHFRGCSGRASGLFVGLRLGASELRVTDTTASELAVNGAGSQFGAGAQSPDLGGSTSRAWAINATPHVGYQAFLFGTGLFVRPWLGANFSVLPKGDVAVGASTWKPRLVTPTGGLHLGFEL
jgi:hypothetical protein